MRALFVAALITTAPTAPQEEVVPPPTLKLDADTLRTKQAFEVRCGGCHSLGSGPRVGPDLAGVTIRRSDDWLGRWLKSPESMLESDEHAKALLQEYRTRMPNQNLSDAQVRGYIRYFHWFDARPAAERMP